MDISLGSNARIDHIFLVLSACLSAFGVTLFEKEILLGDHFVTLNAEYLILCEYVSNVATNVFYLN